MSEASSSNPGLWVFLNLISCVWGPPLSRPSTSGLTDQEPFSDFSRTGCPALCWEDP